MKIICNIFFLMLFVVTIAPNCIGRDYEPTIIVLSPYKVVYDKTFKKEIANLNVLLKDKFKGGVEYDEEELHKTKKNISIMKNDMTKFVRSMVFHKTISTTVSDFLAYTFFDKFENLLITVRDVKCNGDNNNLKTIAITEGFQYVVNIKKLVFYKESGSKMAKAIIQLYNRESDTIVIEKEYIGDAKNYGFEFSCTSNSLECTINNIAAQCIRDIIQYVALHSPTLIAERKLKEQRSFELFNNYLAKPYDTDFIERVIPEADSSIDKRSLFYTLIDETKTKFFSLFIKNVQPYEYDSLIESNIDRNVTIFPKSDIRDGNFLDEKQSIYAYTVKGVYLERKWYYEKSNVMYLDATSLDEGKKEYFNNLQRWNFFKTNTAEFNPDFWVTKQFSIIRDITKDSLWETKGKAYWGDEERRNRKYIGMYEFVADLIRDSIRNDNHIKDSLVSNYVFIPFHEAMLKKIPIQYAGYSLLYDKITLIYPEKRNIFLNPIMITDSKGEKTLHFFVATSDTNQIYEWTYFVPKVLKAHEWHFGSHVIDLLSTITEWNFSFETLDDPKFWNEYVLLKNNGTYMYLKEIHYQ